MDNTGRSCLPEETIQFRPWPGTGWSSFVPAVFFLRCVHRHPTPHTGVPGGWRAAWGGVERAAAEV